MPDQHAETSQAQGIKSIEVGARVLFSLEEGQGSMSLTEIARGAGMHPAKAHRYLASLLRTGLISRDPVTGLYDLGPRSRHLGIEALRRTDGMSIVSAHAVGLRDHTGHTVNVGVWADQGPIVVRWDTGTHLVPIIVRIGSVLPLLDSALGYVFLAHLPDSMTRQVLATQQRQNQTQTLTSAETEEIKATTRRDGFGYTLNRMIFGQGALGAPVFGADGTLEFAMGLIAPSDIMTAPHARRLGAVLRAAADRASYDLGYRAAAHLPNDGERLPGPSA